MGGYGSTRWLWHDKKRTVEDCRILSIFDLKAKGILQPGTANKGYWHWRDSFLKKSLGSMGYELNTFNSSPCLRLFYTFTRWDGSKHHCDYHIHLQTTPCHFGGVRWWFVCPLTRNGRSCCRRVAKLYLPPNGSYFGCRHCYDLTYRSCQESSKELNALKKLQPTAVLEGIKAGHIDLLAGLKALPDWIWQGAEP